MKTQLGEGEYIEVSPNINNPPRIERYTRFTFYDTDDSYTIPAGATGNNTYPTGDTPTYLAAEAIYEDAAARTFAWSSGNFPAQTDGTWYLYCDGAEDVDETSKGKGTYGASKTETPTWSYAKGGYYSAAGYRILAEFTSASGTVALTKVYNDPIHRNSGGDIHIKNNTLNEDIVFETNDGGTITEVLRIDGSESAVNLVDDIKLNFGNGQDGYIYVDSGNELHIGATGVSGTDDIVFETSSTEIMRIDGTNGFIRIIDGARFTVGTGNDGHLYSSSDDFYIDNVTSDKDILFRGNDGGVQKTLITLDASEATDAITTTDAPIIMERNFTVGNAGYTFIVPAGTDSYAFSSEVARDAGMVFNTTSAYFAFRNTTGTENARVSAQSSGESWFRLFDQAGTEYFEGSGVGFITITSPTDVGQASLVIDQNDIDQPFIDFQGTAAGNATASISTFTGTDGADAGWIQVDINNGTKRWIKIYEDPID